MNRQFAKGLTMLMLVVGLALASAAVAHGQSGRVRAQVPFDFIVQDKTLRAGQYEIFTVTNGVLAIRNQDGNKGMRMTNPITKDRRDTKAKLVFHRYGETYFLSEVWLAGNGDGRALPKTKQERALQRELKQIAVYHGNTGPVYETVVVLLPNR